MSVKAMIAITFFFILPSIANANPFCLMPEADRGAVEEFGCKTEQDFFGCSLLSEAGYLQLLIIQKGGEISAEATQGLPTELQNIKTPEDYFAAVNSCIQKSMGAVDPLFSKAKTQLKKAGNNGGLEALKDLYSYWMASMSIDILAPAAGESQLLYKSQLKERGLGISERVNRLKTEL